MCVELRSRCKKSTLRLGAELNTSDEFEMQGLLAAADGAAST